MDKVKTVYPTTKFAGGGGGGGYNKHGLFLKLWAFFNTTMSEMEQIGRVFGDN